MRNVAYVYVDLHKILTMVIDRVCIINNIHVQEMLLTLKYFMPVSEIKEKLN